MPFEVQFHTNVSAFTRDSAGHACELILGRGGLDGVDEEEEGGGGGRRRRRRRGEIAEQSRAEYSRAEQSRAETRRDTTSSKQTTPQCLAHPPPDTHTRTLNRSVRSVEGARLRGQRGPGLLRCRVRRAQHRQRNDRGRLERCACAARRKHDRTIARLVHAASGSLDARWRRRLLRQQVVTARARALSGERKEDQR